MTNLAPISLPSLSIRHVERDPFKRLYVDNLWVTYRSDKNHFVQLMDFAGFNLETMRNPVSNSSWSGDGFCHFVSNRYIV